MNALNVVGHNWSGYLRHSPDSKVHGANMGPTWVLSASDGPHVGPMNLAIRVGCNRWVKYWPGSIGCVRGFNITDWSDDWNYIELLHSPESIDNVQFQTKSELAYRNTQLWWKTRFSPNMLVTFSSRMFHIHLQLVHIYVLICYNWIWHMVRVVGIQSISNVWVRSSIYLISLSWIACVYMICLIYVKWLQQHVVRDLCCWKSYLVINVKCIHTDGI